VSALASAALAATALAAVTAGPVVPGFGRARRLPARPPRSRPRRCPDWPGPEGDVSGSDYGVSPMTTATPRGQAGVVAAHDRPLLPRRRVRWLVAGKALLAGVLAAPPGCLLSAMVAMPLARWAAAARRSGWGDPQGQMRGYPDGPRRTWHRG
jgi:hypothetical protein